jgi:hypothetical protein
MYVENVPRSSTKSTDFPVQNVTTGFGRCRQRKYCIGNHFTGTYRTSNPAETGLQYIPYRTVIYRGEQPSVCAQYEYSTVMQAFRFSFSFSDLGWAWRRKRVPRCTRNEPWRQRYGKRNLLVNRKDINISGIENKD